MNEKPLVIFGAGAFCDVITYIIQNRLHREIAAYTVDRQFIAENERNGFRVIPFEEAEKIYPPEKFDMIIGVGGTQQFALREKKHYEAKEKGYSLPNIIHPQAVIDCESMGEGNIVAQPCVMYPYSRIGDGNIFMAFSNASHHTKIGNFNYFGPGAQTTGYVEVGNSCFLGANCCIKNKVKVADHTLIGAGVFLKYDSQPGDIFKAVTVHAAEKTNK